MSAPGIAGRQPTVLLIEDDELVRDAVARSLVRDGYMVLTASTGHDAVGMLRTPATPVDVVLLDVGLPDVSGADLAKRLRELFPKLPVVVCTGAAGPDEAEALHRLGVARYLCKPVDASVMAAALREVIDASAAEAAEAEQSADLSGL
jgi:DNA-binding NarL/FixJ family response regulator